MSKSLSKPTILFHWLTGLLFIAVFALGLYLGELPKGPEKFELFAVHKSLGFIVLTAAVLRLFWRIKEGAISSVSEMSKWQSVLSKSVHYLLLAATIVMPASGLMLNIGGGRATEVFAIQVLAAGEKIGWLSGVAHFVHVQAVNIIIVVFILHVAGALKHEIIDKDGTLSRMFGR
ncbi:cytochrome b [Psychromonas aquimarina]|uniref:cytochrome b n=1 Tax=Psychromonas aquimarina TaxID=444919 RepID=UPI00040B5553|nr:cytochrome b [Psychromonas aquimarina]